MLIQLNPDRVVHYHESESISNSLLSKLAESPAECKEYLTEDVSYNSEAFLIGGLVDELLTEGDEIVKNKYYVFNGDYPAEQVKAYAEALYKIQYIDERVEIDLKSDGTYETRIWDFESPFAYVEEQARRMIGAKISLKALRAKYNDTGKTYYNALNSSNNKIIISEKQYTLALQVVGMLQTNEFTHQYFTVDSFTGCIYLYQLPIFWECQGEQCKSLLDLVIIDPVNKTIQPVDLKTTGDSVLKFTSNIVKWKYYLQAPFYTDALHYWKESDEAAEVLPELEIKGQNYTVLPFKFIVAEKALKNEPIVFTMTSESLDLGRNGGNFKSGRAVKGYSELLSDLKWHLKNDLWGSPKEVYANGGLLVDL